MNPHVLELFIGKAVPGAKKGSVFFTVDGGMFGQDNDNLFFSEPNKYLRVGFNGSGHSLFLGVSAMSGFGGGYELIYGNYSFDGAARYVLTNPSSGTSAHSTVTVTASGGFDTSLFSVGAGWVLGGASGNAVANEGGIILNNIWAGGAGAAGMLFCNRTNSYMRFATNNLERMRILSGGPVLINATTQNASEQFRVNGSATINSLTSGRVTFASTNGLLFDDNEFQWDNTNKALYIGGVVPSTLRRQIYIAAAAETRIYTRSTGSNSTYIFIDRGTSSMDGTLVFTTANDQNGEWTFGQRGTVTPPDTDIQAHFRLGGVWTEFWRLSTAGLNTITNSNATLVPQIHLLQAGAGDSGLRWARSAAPMSYIAGIDATDGKWKVSYAANVSAVLGTNDYFTISSAGVVAFPTALTPNGLVVIGTGGSLSRMAPGTDGYVLKSDSTQSNGFAWTAMTGGTVVSDPTRGGYITLDRVPKNPLARTLWAPHPKRVKLVDMGPHKRLMITGPQDIAPSSNVTFNSVNLPTFVSVVSFGADSTGTNDSTAAIIAAYKYCKNIYFPPGTYRISARLNVPDGAVWRFDGATILYSTTNDRAISCDALNSFELIGHLTINMGGATTPLNNTAVGIYVSGCNRYRVENLTCKNINGTGIYIDPGTYTATRGDQGQWGSVAAFSCYIGLYVLPGTGAEYNIFSSFNAGSCVFGAQIYGGNTVIMGGNIVENTTGIYLGSGSNHGHGQIHGCQISHNTSYNVRAEAVTNGFSFVGCSMYADSNASGYIYFQNSKGVHIVKGIVDSPIQCDGTTGTNVVAGNFMPGTYADTFSGSNPELVWCHRNWTTTGPWVNNDPAHCYVEASRATSNQALVSGAATTIVFNAEAKDKLSAFDTTTGTFTAPIAGRYRVIVNVTVGAAAALVNSYCEFMVSGVTKGYINVTATTATLGLGNAVIELQLAAADTVTIRATITGTNPFIDKSISTLEIASMDGGR